MEINRMMSFNCKPILSGFEKVDGTQAVYLQSIIDRKRCVVPLGFFVPTNQFKNGRVKSSFPNSDLLNLEIGKAIGRAHQIASEYRLSDRLLTPTLFRQEFVNPINKNDFLVFARHELEIRKPKIDIRTYEQNKFALEKLETFSKTIMFAQLTPEFVQRYINFETNHFGNCDNTINKTLATWRLYINLAISKGVKFTNPFKVVKIKAIKPHKVALSMAELKKIIEYYRSPDCLPTHQHLLRYFLFCCANGIRISDIKRLKWEHISDGVITILPHKTRRFKKSIQIPMSDFEIQLLPENKISKESVFDCYADPVSNRMLKDVAKKCGIKKKITFHMSRHTFGTLFLEQGGRVEVLQYLMGHSEIDTTMIYVHMTDQRKLIQKKEAFDSLAF